MSLTGPNQVKANSVAALWAKYDSQQLGWAFRAYDRFMESLSPEIRERLAYKEQREEAYVVVFGKTQVGKTTLLMDLMGVEPALLERVSLVLRGGRAQGQSATATTMEYRRSTDRRWGLQTIEAVTQWFDDDQSITEALGQLRNAMENRQLTMHAPCTVYIPADCFDLQSGHSSVRMLDLPGDKPANPTEQEYVQEMARKYVPLADLILLVGRGDDLSFLRSGCLTLPGIEDWQSVPSRFRIITTFSFTPQSVKDLVRQHNGLAKAAFYRQRLIEQIEKPDTLNKDARRPERYFPLEFGATWLHAQKSDLELYERVSPMLKELKHQLHEDIKASTIPTARLRNAVEARVVIAHIKETRLKELQAATDFAKQQLSQALAEQSQAQEAVRQSRKVSQDLAERLTGLNYARLEQDIKDQFELSINLFDRKPDESVSDFKILVREAQAHLKQQISNSHPKIDFKSDTVWFWRSVKLEIDLQYIDSILDAEFSSFLSHLNDYWLDKYWKNGNNSDYQRDHRWLKKCIQNVSKELTEFARKAWLTNAKKQLAEYQEKDRVSHITLRSWMQMVEDMDTSIDRLKQKLSNCNQETDSFQKRMEKDLQESQRFIELLDTEYLTELNNRRTVIMNEARPVCAFMGLLAVVKLEKVRKQLLLNVEPA